MKIVLLVVLGLLSLAMLGGGVWAIWDANRSKPNLPLLFQWAQGPNKVLGTIFGVVLGGAGIGIGALVISNI
jgi:hypothetical protein